MRTEEYSEIGSEEELGESETEDELSESETEDELGSSESEDVSYRLEEEDCTEDESDGSEGVEEITKNEIQIDDLKAKKVKKDVRRYCCQKRSKDENHGLKERNVRRYCCGLCGFTRIRRNSLKAHVISEHRDEIISKGETDCYIAKMRSEHASKSRDTRRYNCSICGLVRSKRKPLKAHLISYHGVEDAIDELIEKKNAEECETLQSEASNSKRVENNGSKVRELRRYCCKLCGLIRAKRELLKNHIHSEHDEEMGSDDVDKFIAKKCSEDDQRRYSCQICGVVRSKRRFLKLHVMSSHGPDALKKMRFALERVGVHSQNVCDLCGMSFRKPAHLQQHKLSHSPLRSFVCPIDGCLCSYKRQDHLNRHLLKHEGELFMCPREDCKLQFSTLSNLKRHLKQHRERGELWQSQNVKSKEREKHCCPEPNCKKVFKYPSKLAKHLDDVHRTTYTEVICCEPGCLKYFTNAEALKEHLQQNHNRVCCEICGSQQLKKQIKRHMRIHENQTCVKSISCPYERCQHSYTTKSNLNQHIKSVHLGLKPFKCRFGECRMTYAHKSARDRHETSGAHCYVQGNFLEEDAAFQSRPRGGRKRKAFTVDSIFRKRVAGPDESTVLENGLSYMYWLTSNHGD